ncbi:hypothetical protein NFI96_033618 [Prochilodus magdalenae]|nr:hypothetical protein NFI96_033618 [Prochilodus magdalenae]
MLVRHHHECVNHEGRHFTEGAIRARGFDNRRKTSRQQVHSQVCHMQRGVRKNGATTKGGQATDKRVVSSMSHPVSAASSADGCTTQDYMHTDRYHDCP